MLQFIELRDMPDEQSREAPRTESVTIVEGSQRCTTSVGKYKIINATTSGAAYTPTPAQILAAEMAEEFYRTQVTFVHADATTFKSIVQELTGNGNSSSDLALGSSNSRLNSQACGSPKILRTKRRANMSGGLQKNTTFKQPGNRANSKTVELQQLQLWDASPSGRTRCCAAVSPMPSPVSPLTVFNEFENYSSGDRGQGSADSQCQDHDCFDFRNRGSDDDDDSQTDIDGGFTFPHLYKEATIAMPSRPKLLHLFPEAPSDR